MGKLFLQDLFFNVFRVSMPVQKLIKTNLVQVHEYEKSPHVIKKSHLLLIREKVPPRLNIIIREFIFVPESGKNLLHLLSSHSWR